MVFTPRPLPIPPTPQGLEIRLLSDERRSEIKKPETCRRFPTVTACTQQIYSVTLILQVLEVNTWLQAAPTLSASLERIEKKEKTGRTSTENTSQWIVFSFNLSGNEMPSKAKMNIKDTFQTRPETLGSARYITSCFQDLSHCVTVTAVSEGFPRPQEIQFELVKQPKRKWFSHAPTKGLVCTAAACRAANAGRHSAL